MAKNIGAIIQARMGSTRLPGKVLKEINKKTILEILINRLKKSKYLDEIIVATTINIKDNMIANFCKKRNIKIFRGSEENVLKRYLEAAKEFDIDIIVRVTSDNPLTSIFFMDKLIESHLEKKPDYTYSDNLPIGTYVEVVDRNRLENIIDVAKDKDSKEHVTLYLKNHPEKYVLNNVSFDVEDSSIRLTVDTDEDFQLIQKIAEELGDLEELDVRDVFDFLLKNPVIRKINEHIKQKIPGSKR